MGLILWLGFLIALLILILFLNAIWYQFSRTIPGPFVWPVIGAFVEIMIMFQRDTWQYLKYFSQRYRGNTFEAWFFGTRLIFTNDADFIDHICNKNAKVWLRRNVDNDPTVEGKKLIGMYHQGLISNDHIERWKLQRSIFLKSLRNDLLVHAAQLSSQKVKQILGSLSVHLNSNGQIDANPFIRRVITDVVFSLAFGEDLNTVLGGENETSKLVKIYFEGWKYFSQMPTIVWRYFGGAKVKKYLDTYAKLQAIIDRIIKKEKLFLQTHGKETIGKPNFIQLLLLSSMDDSTSGLQLSESEVRQCALEMILGGTDTSVNVTSNVLYTVAEFPDVEKKICAEIETLGLKEAECPTAAQLSELKYLEAVIRETMRHYPAISMTTRGSTEDDIVGGYFLPKDTWVIAGLFPQQRKYFGSDTDSFRPERFLEKETLSQIHNCAYLPFGSGPRNCVGQYLAMVQMKAILVEMYRRVKLRLPEGKSMRNLKREFELIIHPSEPMWLYVENSK